MSLETCSICGKEFLTESDDYVVRPINRYALVCWRCFSFTKEKGLAGQIVLGALR